MTSPCLNAHALAASQQSARFRDTPRGIAKTLSTAIIISSVFLIPLAGLRLSHAATVRPPLQTESTTAKGMLKWADELNAKASFKYPQSAFFRDGMAY
jgi:hypothetical protein